MHQQGVRGRGDAPAGSGGKRGCTPSAKMLDEEVGLDLGISICVCSTSPWSYPKHKLSRGITSIPLPHSAGCPTRRQLRHHSTRDQEMP